MISILDFTWDQASLQITKNLKMDLTPYCFESIFLWSHI